MPAVGALALPVLTGAAWMVARGAPDIYPLANLAALGFAAVLILLRPITFRTRWLGVVSAVCVAAMALTLVLSPEVNGVRRWLAIGPFALNAGLLFVPLLAALLGRDPRATLIAVFALLAIALLQPDAATAFAVSGMATGIYLVSGRWSDGVAALAAFGTGLLASVRGVLPPQPFVERMVVDAALVSLPAGLVLLIASVAAFCLMAFATPAAPRVRAGVAGSFAGYSIAAFVADYPTPLLGYGVAAIVGYALPFAVRWPQRQTENRP